MPFLKHDTMRILFTILSLVTIFSASFGQEWNEKYGAPIVVLVETDPWLMVIGSDVPTIAIYQYGDVIYKRIENKKINYYSVKLDTAETQKLIYGLGISDSLIKMPAYTTATDWTDQPTNELILNFDSARVKSVYGDLRNKGESRNRTPKYFLNVYDNLIDYKNKKEKAWLPDFIEIMLTDYGHSPEEPLKWPSDWPDLKSKSTIMRSESLYSIYLEKDRFNDFINLVRSLKEKQAVEINSVKFSVSYRFPFPNLR
jgi:hypothetical protein